MTAAQITGGTVEYTKPSNYNTDKPGAKVVLSFMCAEGCSHSDAEAILDTVARMAVAKTFTMVGDKAPPVEEKVEAAKQTRRAKAPPAEVPAENPTEIAVTDETAPAVSSAATSAPSDDPAAIGDPEEAADPVVHTDKDLRTAVNYAIGEKKVASARIVALIIEFTNPPGTPEGERVPGKNIPMIEQDRRGEFLARLKALYADA